jgi:hypothetical protein
MRRRSTPAVIGLWVCCSLLPNASCKGALDNGMAAARGTLDAGPSTLADAASGSSPDGSSALAPDAGRPAGLAGRAAMDAAMVDASAAGGGGSGGNGGATSEGGSDAQTTDPEEGEPVIVAVGYLGLRVRSRDLGQSWQDKQTFPDPGGSLDNPLLLRSAAYGNGLFVAAGHRIFTSPDGATWTERDNPSEQWIGGLQWGNGRFVGAGGNGESWYSVDGVEWSSGGRIDADDNRVRSVAFGDGEFRAASHEGEWWSSTDGESWQHVSDGHTQKVAFCNGEFADREECGPAFGHGVYIRDNGWDGNKILASEDGDSWHEVAVEYRGGLEDVAFGFAPAP